MNARRSIDILAPLLSETWRASPAWKSWVAHVRLLTFCLQHEFELTDVQTCDTLVSTYLGLFRAVPQYKGYEKPKHHFLIHLSKYLKLYGPFRKYWCMPWEAFLQILKHMFQMTNYKSAPTTVANMWSVKAARALAAGPRAIWYEDVLVLTGDLITDLYSPACASSELVRLCRQEAPSAIRMLSSLVRGPEEISLGCWVHVSTGGVTVVGRVDEMAQLSFHTSNAVRLLCRDCRSVNGVSVDVLSGQLSVSTQKPGLTTRVKLEEAAVSVMHCSEVEGGYVLRPAL